ncbi:MAG: hypothetical protein V3U11_00415 [Planctomycetota bacterium]
MTSPRTSLGLLVMFTGVALTGPAAAQTQQPPKQSKTAPKKKSRKLTGTQLAGRLAKFKEDIAGKIIPMRLVKKGQRRMDKWLDRFQAVQSEHYIVFTNGPSLTVKRFAKSLEELYTYVGKQFPMDDVDHLLEAYIFNDKPEYLDFCVQIVGWTRDHAERSAGHACAKYYVTYYQSPKSAAVMHEATHQLVAANMKTTGVGSWFQEGMAVWVEKTILGDKPAAAMRTDLRNGDFYHLRDFIRIESLLMDDNGHGHRNYDHAGALIDFFIHAKHPKMNGKFNMFLRAARRNFARGPEITERLFQRTYGMSVDEVEVAWALHHRVRNAKTRAEKLIEKKRRRGK